MVADNVFVRTIVPILLLIGIGFLSRKMEILKRGDERVLSAYVYYFALPALFFVNMAETELTEEALRFVLAGIVPVLLVTSIYVLTYGILGFSKNTLYLLVLSTVFGSLAFFGIPFITFAFPTMQGEHLAALSSASISMVSVTFSITVLELYKLEKSSVGEGLRIVARRLSRNPLIISILSGAVLSIVGIDVPSPLSVFLHMLGGTTSTVAIFMLGVFFYGRKYKKLHLALQLSVLRIVFLPTVALVVTGLFNLRPLEKATLVLMHGMPVAVSMMVLSERYGFYEDTFASLILVSSLGAGAYLNLWLFLLNLS
ncbi:MAG: AEC family transporter [Candidatus Bathyarchaeota archaeon]|nr:AEC family transporter [Candidatus Bathyarchaeota archaeon]